MTADGAGRLTDADRVRFLRDCWWSHDGQWFLKARDRFGLDAALDLNEASIESMGRIEMRRLHAMLGAPPVVSAHDLLPLVLEVSALIGLDVEGEPDGPDAFLVRERSCLVWEMTEAAGLEHVAPGCRGSMRRRLGWATALFPRERVEWTRVAGPPEGTDGPCAHRFRLLD